MNRNENPDLPATQRYPYHHCGHSHYGDMTIFRDSCVIHYLERKEIRDKVALSADHPAAKLEIATWNHLTTAEQTFIKGL